MKKRKLQIWTSTHWTAKGLCSLKCALARWYNFMWWDILGTVNQLLPTTSVDSWRRKWQPMPVFLPGKSHGWRSLVGYSPRGRKESDTTERLIWTELNKSLSLVNIMKCWFRNWEAKNRHRHTHTHTVLHKYLEARVLEFEFCLCDLQCADMESLL